MTALRRNRGIMIAAIVLGAVFVALDHSRYRRSAPAPDTGEFSPQVETGGYGSASDDSDSPQVTGLGAETGGYGAAGDDSGPSAGPAPEAGGYGAAAGDADTGEDMEEYYRRLQLDAETDDAR